MPRLPFPRPPAWLWLIAAAGVSLSLLAASLVRDARLEDTEQQFASAADQITLRIEERLAAYALVLRGAAGLFDASEEVDRDEWRLFVDKLHATDALGHIQGIGYTEWIPADRLAAHEARVRAEGFPDYRVQPAGPREAYTAIVYLEPFAGRNLRAFGYDMYAEPVRRAAMEQARDTGRAALTGRVELVQETGEDVQPGTLMYVPVYRQGMPIETVTQRRAALAGWAYSPYRMYDLMRGLLDGWQGGSPLPVGLRLHDGGGTTPDTLLYHHPADLAGQAPGRFSQQREISFNGRRWTLTFEHLAPPGALEARGAWLTLAGGLVLTALLVALLLSLLTTRARAVRIGDRLTVAIREREAELEQLFIRLRTIADRVPGVVYEYCLQPDGRSRFPYASDGMQQVYGVAPEAIREDATPVFSTIHPDDQDGVTTSIRHSAETLTPWRHEYRVILPDGSEHWLLGDSLPHREPDGATTWYGVITDITERKQAEMTLRRAHQEAERFREALDLVTSFIYMKDRDSRYTYANRATLALFGCSAEELVGSDDSRYFTNDTVRRLRKVDARVLGGEPTTEEVVTTDPDGQRRVYLEIKAPIRVDGGIVGLMGISSDITLLKEHERQLEHLAHYDALTGLPNRVLLADRLHQAMAQELRLERLLALVYLDLDGFKEINDRHGHAAGDQMLIRLAERLSTVMRESDTLSRLGGDEFVVLLRELPDRASANSLLERLLETAALPITYEGHALSVTASLGVTFYPQAEPVEADQLLRQADQAMYQAKLAGKGRYHFFDAEQDRSVRSHYETLSRLQQALEEQEFELHYQPKVNLRTGEVVGVEALLRWHHPDRGLLMPGQFLPALEDHPFAEALGEWVIRSALSQAVAWRRAGIVMPVSVNIGARQLRQQDFPARLGQLLVEQPSLPPDTLELEVLETSALGDLALVAGILEACRRTGVQVSLDDFGTGYSSLTYLKRLPAGTIKVDQSFVHDILEDPEDLKILVGVLGLAGTFGRQVLAEGVETVPHGDLLLRLGCELGQGYGIARPMPAAAIPEWLTTWRPPAHWASLAPVVRERLPLLYAGVEHRAWIQQLAAALESGGAPPHLSPAECRFQHWIGRVRDRLPLGYERLDEHHEAVHRLARELMSLHGGGRQPQAMARLGELHALSDALLEELDRLLD